MNFSITSLDGDLVRRLEPRSSMPAPWLDAIAALAKARIPVGVLVAPVIPGLTDHEIPAILKAASDAGAQWAGKVVLRFPHAVGSLFSAWLNHHVPEKSDRVLNRIRALHGGRLDDARFGTRMRGQGLFAEQILRLFRVSCRRAGLPSDGPELSAVAFRRPAGTQLELGV